MLILSLFGDPSSSETQGQLLYCVSHGIFVSFGSHSGFVSHLCLPLILFYVVSICLLIQFCHYTWVMTGFLFSIHFQSILEFITSKFDSESMTHCCRQVHRVSANQIIPKSFRNKNIFHLGSLSPAVDWAFVFKVPLYRLRAKIVERRLRSSHYSARTVEEEEEEERGKCKDKTEYPVPAAILSGFVLSSLQGRSRA